MTYKEFMQARANNLPTVKIGGAELFEQEIFELLEKKQEYIVNYKKVYQIATANYKREYLPFYGRLVYTSPEPLTKRGRFVPMTAKEINHLLGFDLLSEN